ncbi:Ig mu chain C region secreted form [Xyrauchen texanus]|uniref:Ig mu chain C region secreted form n=1 Tax=Xyrauchen texanus TaxID=154827 RepID=UPI002241B230|nr:Ig mu chain C region secreted form [Xyrauchen texanus]
MVVLDSGHLSLQKTTCHEDTFIFCSSDDIKKVPVVEISRPFTESTEAGSAVLECVVRNVPSGEACVIFQANGLKISEVNCFDLTPSESIRSLTAHFTIPSEHQKKENIFTCKVHTSFIKQWESNHTGNLFDDPTIELSVVTSVGQSSSQLQKLVCTGAGFEPKIRWLSKSKEKTGTVVDFTIRKDGRMKVYSEILVQQQEWSQGVAYTCEIVDRHNVKTAETSVCSVIAHSSQLADVYLLGPSLSDVRYGTDVTLTCLVIGQGVNFSIKWKLDGNFSNFREYTQGPEDHANGTQSMKRILKVPVRIWHAYTLFTCQVKHLCSGNLQQQNISKNRDPKQPTVRILRPSDNDLSGSEDVSLLCFITGFFPSDISVHWQLNGTQLDVSRFTNSPVVAHTARYYSMHSALILPASQWTEGIYSCVVSHESSKDSIIATLENLYASLIYSAPSAKLLQGSNELVCLAFGFSPSAIKFTWLLGMTELSGHTVTSPAKGPDGKFWIQSHLKLLPSDWAPGEVYSCRVTHISDTLLINISKPGGGPPPTELSDTTKLVQDILGADSPVLAGITGGLESEATQPEEYNTEPFQQSKQLQHRQSTPNQAAKKTQIPSPASTREEVLELQRDVIGYSSKKRSKNLKRRRKIKTFTTSFLITNFCSYKVKGK